MKVRNDFVSNSSSSSFVLFGAKVTNEELLELWKKSDKYDPDIDDDDIDYFEIIDSLMYDRFGVVEYDSDWGRAYVGERPDTMNDDQTLSEFKQSIVDKFTEMGIVKRASDIEFISGVDCDGEISLD